jgi:hypothetical protein
MAVIEGTVAVSMEDLGEDGEKMCALYDELAEAMLASMEGGLNFDMTLSVLTRLIATAFVRAKVEGHLPMEASLDPVFLAISQNAVAAAEDIKSELREEIAAESAAATKH